MDKPNNLRNIIEDSIKIINRFYKIFLEKRDFIVLGDKKTGKEVGGSYGTRRCV
jgi:hypothetical protein